MRTVIQRVTSCTLSIEGQEYSHIGYGVVLLVSFEEADTPEDREWLCSKVTGLRIFDDSQGAMDLDIRDIDGEIMVVSQFTLHASTRRGNRPSYSKAARPDFARAEYDAFIESLQASLGREVATGQFGAYMEVALVNDGPVTIFIDTKNRE
jgi:D-tyrosyl-tRNA(Tyr) deacylase